jgi:hypothetical protein
MKYLKKTLLVLTVLLILLYITPMVMAKTPYEAYTDKCVKTDAKCYVKPVLTPKPVCTPIPTYQPLPDGVVYSKIKGVKYCDANWNCKYDCWEKRICGVKIILLDEWQCPIAETYTDKNGYYCFPCVAPGCYYVSECVPEGYISTTPSCVKVIVTPCYREIGCCFGNVPIPPSGNDHAL